MNAEIVSGRGKRKAEGSTRPLSDLVAQGWEVQHYHPLVGTSAMLEHVFHLSRQREHKVLVVRRKVMGDGMYGEEFDI